MEWAGLVGWLILDALRRTCCIYVHSNTLSYVLYTSIDTIDGLCYDTMVHDSEKQWKFARLVSQLDSLGWVEGQVDLEGLLVHGDCRVFVQIAKFLFERFWDVVGGHIVKTSGAQKMVKGVSVVESAGHEGGGVDRNGLKVLEVAFGSIQKYNIVFRRVAKVAREVLGVKVCLHEEQFVKKVR
jgi:hypothetical protein